MSINLEKWNVELEKKVEDLEGKFEALTETLRMVMVGCGVWTKEEAERLTTYFKCDENKKENS